MILLRKRSKEVRSKRGNISVYRPRRVRFIAGIALIAISFLVYPAFPIIILFLPSSGSVKFVVIVALSLLSWCAFSAGILLAGLEGYEWLKEAWKRRTGGGRRRERNGNGFSE
jgi:hypothetical protein